MDNRSLDERAIPQGELKSKKYKNYYDNSSTITTALASNPNSADHPSYNSEPVYRVLQRYSDKISVINDGTDTLYVIVSHNGTSFTKEVPIYQGEQKEYYNIYEIRLRSPTVSVPFRVTEYPVCKCATTPYGSLSVPLQQDNISNNLRAIDTVHRRIHEGKHFNATDVSTSVNIATPKRYLLITPNTSTRIHMIYRVETVPGSKIELYEGSTVTNNGTSISTPNSKRDSTNTSTLLVFENPTVTGDGTLLFEEQSGSSTAGGKLPAEVQHDDETILAQNTIYQLKITPLSNGTDISTHIDWYEV